MNYRSTRQNFNRIDESADDEFGNDNIIDEAKNDVQHCVIFFDNEAHEAVENSESLIAKSTTISVGATQIFNPQLLIPVCSAMLHNIEKALVDLQASAQLAREFIYKGKFCVNLIVLSDVQEVAHGLTYKDIYLNYPRLHYAKEEDDENTQAEGEFYVDQFFKMCASVGKFSVNLIVLSDVQEVAHGLTYKYIYLNYPCLHYAKEEDDENTQAEGEFYVDQFFKMCASVLHDEGTIRLIYSKSIFERWIAADNKFALDRKWLFADIHCPPNERMCDGILMKTRVVEINLCRLNHQPLLVHPKAQSDSRKTSNDFKELLLNDKDKIRKACISLEMPPVTFVYQDFSSRQNLTFCIPYIIRNRYLCLHFNAHTMLTLLQVRGLSHMEGDSDSRGQHATIDRVAEVHPLPVIHDNCYS
ncbi:hypothetical protein Tco_1200864 [Tanacetum coccineum]